MTTNIDTPVLFLVFNRLDTTKQVFKTIRNASPQKLYIASDGSRDDREGEKEKVKAVREYILSSIDWDCEVNTLFREKNFGCGKAVSEAITWFFENEEMGIILEDDCLPSISFFYYCKELLEKYKDHSQIFHIAGYNPLTQTKIPYSYYFARLHHCWGWASWRRAWNYYKFDICDLDDFIAENKIDLIFKRTNEKIFWLDIFKKMEQHKIDTWDYQWTYTIFNQNGLCINPSDNLVTNIGFGADATHTINKDPKHNNQARYEITEIVHPLNININNRILKKINKVVFGIHKRPFIKTKIKNILKKYLLGNFLYVNNL
ncbi:MAG: nucleotide-diphospho-sugar transferase [Treponema sp.]|nr:nucleotide-diphospho-sugar transferase [Treponema sp.]